MRLLTPLQIENAKEFLALRTHGDAARSLERFLALPSGELLDLASSMNPAAPSYSSLILRNLDGLKSYPEAMGATKALAEVLEVDPKLVVLTNGGSEGIALVARVTQKGYVRDPEFSLYRRHISGEDTNGLWWASNPNNPTGRLLDPSERPGVVDEAFYPLATGVWTRRDFEHGSFVIGSLTKLFALPGLRVGYVVAPDYESSALIRDMMPQWSLNGLAAEILPALLSEVDLGVFSKEIQELRAELTEILRDYGVEPYPSCANYVYVPEAKDLYARLLRHKILVRDTFSFGLAGGIRIAVPGSVGMERVRQALSTKTKSRVSRSVFSGSLMVVGTTSDAGKSTLVAALCRILSDKGVSVAPFKAQNMSLNSAVTPSGYEIGRAQAHQAYAARIPSQVEMNPILLKPTSQHSSQVVVMGEPLCELNAKDYQAKKLELLEVVLDAHGELSKKFDVVVMEGAGSPAEINLLQNDLVNLGLARRIGAKALLVGDIDRGGVFASLFGTTEILPVDLSSLITGFVINKIRGDLTLLESGITQLEALSRRKVFGVLPYFDKKLVDLEDSLGLSGFGDSQDASFSTLDIAVISLPSISNFTDFDPLVSERSCNVRMIRNPGQLGVPDLVIIPGSKATVSDLNWIRSTGFEGVIKQSVNHGSLLLGICGGYQMLGKAIFDGVESECSFAKGIGLLDVETVFYPSKVTLQRHGKSTYFDGVDVTGYQIHQGRVRSLGAKELFWLAEPARSLPHIFPEDGVVDKTGRIFGTTLHGIFEGDAFRSTFLGYVAKARSKEFISDLRFLEVREGQVDFLAKFVAHHLDLDALFTATGLSKVV